MRTLIFIVIGLLCIPRVEGQCNRTARRCYHPLRFFEYDGQYYRVQLFEGESAKLKVFLYSGMAYRIVPCADEGTEVIFELYDPTGVRLYTTQSHQDFWDLSLGASGEYTIVGRLRKGEGCLTILIGYMSRDRYEQLAQNP